MSINLPKFTDLDYINFLIAASNVYSCSEAARCFPSSTDAPSHDCFTRLLQKQPSDTEPLWAEVRKFVTPSEGYLIVDDTMLDKPYSKKIGFVRYQWNEKHHRTVKGIGFDTLLGQMVRKSYMLIFVFITSMKTKKPKTITSLICLTRPKNADLNRSLLCLIYGMQA